MRGLWMGLAVISVIGLQAPALSEPAPAPAAKNSNEIVCERIEVIGTRLGSKRVCGTRAEWAEKRKLDREAVDQAQRAANGPCQTVNTHSGAPAC